ncbi:MAG: ADP-ribosylglycohydrolase family protein [Armatimonadetes bacterium]|nr:ADP-ribosylglycohydrolase family protein [Armatimonadota bacterium]
MPDLQSRFAGCLLGGALGDALGAPIEFLSLNEIRARYGPHGLQEFVPAYGRLGAITDDTQMTMFTAEGLLQAYQRGQERGIWDPPSMVHVAYLRWLRTQGQTSADPLFHEAQRGGGLSDLPELNERRGPGRTCLSALMSDHMGTVEHPLNNSKGCGGIMRIAPVGLACRAGARTPPAFDLGCEIAAITHGHPSGYLAAGTLAEIIAHIASHGELGQAIWLARQILQAQPGHEECLAALDRALHAAESGEVSAEQVERLGEGWVAEEALAIAVYCALVALDFRHGICLAANHSGDSDSTAALTGNLLGAKWGRDALPADLLDQLELRDTIERLATDLHAAFAGE